MEPISRASALTQNNQPHIRKIYRGSETDAPKHKQLRVAAYCRVSTDQEAQMTSLETQVSAFRQKIASRPGWELVDIYVDEGLSGTNAKKRKAFQRMITDCEAGKIDYIITKSISRFARNTLECISYIRHLQKLGVGLLFEKENIDTGNQFSEMVLTVLAAFAQEESRSISANATWSIRKAFEVGRARWKGWYGYRKGEDGEIEIVPEEAEVVRRVYSLYERGKTLRAITRQLNEEGIPSPRGMQWQFSRVSDILKNEVYIGDILLQKYRTVDHLSHRSVRNDAVEVPSYYVTNHHPAIVNREVYDRVQRITALRRFQGEVAPQYPYGETDIRCPLCGARLVQRNTHGNERVNNALGCFEEKGCGKFALRMERVSGALLEAYNGMDIEAIRGKARQGQEMEAVQHFLRMKMEQARMETVEMYWLDELVERIELEEADMQISSSPAGCWWAVVHWRCGLESRVLMPLGRHYNMPEAVAEQYYNNEAKYRARRAAEKKQAAKTNRAAKSIITDGKDQRNEKKGRR